MIYLIDSDLNILAQTRLKEESVADFAQAIEEIEAMAVEEVKAALHGRYDIDRIFGDPPVRNSLLTKIILRIVLYDLLGRNAARKVPEDHEKNWEWALKMLGKISAGTQILPGMPTPETGSDKNPGELMYGNNTNRDFFI
jgi:16S rRNA G966 N2-methylase RsmD